MIKPLFRILCCTTLALGLVFAPLPPAAGQDITIDSYVDNHVIGNSPDGEWDWLNDDFATLLDPNNNSVTVTTGGEVVETVYGGFANIDTSFATANSNTVNIEGDGKVGGFAHGGSVYIDGDGNATANSNTVNISDDGYVYEWVYGGHALIDGDGNATANSNTVNISDNGYGDLGVTGGFAYSRTGTATANSNTVNISDDGYVGSDVRGGYAHSDDSTVQAMGNTVNISGGAVGKVYGGWANIYVTGTATATGNTVNISGGTVGVEVYGGRAESASGIATATGNTVNISGSPDLSASTLYGGFTAGAGAGDARTGNTLNLHSPVTVASVQNFANWNFYLPSDREDGDTMLTVTGTAALGTSAKVNVAIAGGSSPLEVGDTVKLIDAGALTGTLANDTANGSGMQGITLRYEFDLLADTTNGLLLATVTGIGVSGHLKALLEGRLAGLAFAGWGSDMIMGPGMYAAMTETKGKGAGLVPFAALRGGSVRYDTGSHIDVDGVHLLAGLAWRAPLAGKNNLVTGAFFEAGWGSYDSRNSFSNMPSVKGKGDTNYYGGGVLGRYEAKAGPGGVYGEGSLRAGYADTDFRSSDILNSSGGKTKYDSGAMYYGAHLGAGYVWNINKKASLDLSTKYIWLHLDSDSVNISGDKVKFKAANSHRWRTGGQFSYAVNTYVTPYVGAYFDYEFDGKAKGTSNGYKIDAPEFDGATGTGELGLVFTPAPKLPLSLDLGVQGYVGTREGVTGSLRMKYEF